MASANQRFESDKHFRTATVNRYTAVRIWLPQTLVEAAKRRTTHPPIRTHEELQRVLEVEQLRDVWYALTIREHHDDGAFHDLTVIRQPYDDPRHFPEFPEVLAVVGGNHRSDPTVDFSLASVCVVPEDFRDRTPREVMGEMLATGLK